MTTPEYGVGIGWRPEIAGFVADLPGLLDAAVTITASQPRPPQFGSRSWYFSRQGFRNLAISAFSVLLACYVLFVRLFKPDESVPGWAFLGVGMFMLSGIQLVMMGVIGSYLGRVYVEAQDRPLYTLAMVARDQPGDRAGDLPGDQVRAGHGTPRRHRDMGQLDPGESVPQGADS